MDETIQDKLSGADSTKSLRAERRVSEAFRAKRWDTYHGPFYRDPETKKLREVDVVARQVWVRRLKSGQQAVRLHLYAEVKSIKGYHLLFSRYDARSMLHYQLRLWPGTFDQGKHRWLKKALLVEGLSDAEVLVWLRKFEQVAFPRQRQAMSTGSFEPPPVKWWSSAFRETNIGAAKDLDNSVLWRSVLALRSSFASLRRYMIDYHGTGIAGAYSAAKTFDESPSEWLGDSLRRHATMVDYFHPVVFVEAPIWVAGEKSITSVPWVRFVQLNPLGLVISWCDVVHLERLKEYVVVVSKHYERQRQRLKAQRLAEDAS